MSFGKGYEENQSKIRIECVCVWRDAILCKVDMGDLTDRHLSQDLKEEAEGMWK